MKFEKIHLFLILSVILSVLYVVNIFNINNISVSIVSKPVKLSFIVIEPNEEQCEECFDAESIIGLMNSTHNIKITRKKIITTDSFKYDKLVEQYKIKNIPAIIVSGDVVNSKITGVWKSLSVEEKDGSIVIQNLLPFYDIKEQKQKGLVDVVLLKDETCSNCFEATQYLETLKRSAMTVRSYLIYDISSSEGKFYIEKYKIKKVPTLLISKSADDYPGFTESWKDVGTIALDGWFIFREVQNTGGEFSEI